MRVEFGVVIIHMSSPTETCPATRASNSVKGPLIPVDKSLDMDMC